MLQASRYVNILSFGYNVAIVASIFLNEDYQNMYDIFSPRRQVKVTYNPITFLIFEIVWRLSSVWTLILYKMDH